MATMLGESTGAPRGETIHAAAWRGDMAAMQTFVTAAEDMGYPAAETLQQKDGVSGDTPLHKAVENNRLELVKWLLARGVMPNVKDNHGVTPLHVAAIKGHQEIMEILMETDESIKKVTDNNGDTAVHWAATKGHLEILDYLLSRGAALDIANKQGWTALHRAAFNGRSEVMDRLLNAGASLHAMNQDCNTALHLASHNNHLGAISLLLKWGAKTDMRNAEGMVPVELGAVPGVRAIIEEWEISHPPKQRKATKIGSPSRPTRTGSTDKDLNIPSGLAKEAAAAPDFVMAENPAGHPPLASPAPPSSARPSNQSRSPRVSSPGMNPTPTAASQEAEAAQQKKPWDVDVDFQERLRNHNRQLRQQGSLQSKESMRKARPVSGNKKFLQNYNLEKHKGLFSP